MNQRGNGHGSGWGSGDWGSGPSGASGPYQGPSEGAWQLPDGGSYPTDSAAHHSEPLTTRFPQPGGYQQGPAHDTGYGYYDGGESYYAAAPAAPAPSSRGGVGWLVPLLVVAIVAVAGLGAYLVTSDRGGDEPTAAPDSPPAVAAPSSTEASSAAPSSEATETTESSTSVAPSTSAQSSTPRSSSRPSASDDANLPAGLSTHGWTGQITCNASDEWVYAGGNGSDYAVICKATPGGGLYYRGLFRGGTAEHDIAEYTLGDSPSFHTVPSGDTSIYISGADLTVFGAGDAVLAETTFTTALVR